MTAPALRAGMSRGEAVTALRRAFAAAGLESAALDARLLAADAFGIAPGELAIRPEAPLGPEEAERLGSLARRRLAREPVGRIRGEREFWGLPFRLSPATLEPRPDTETVVEAALRAVGPDGPRTVLDLGTGTGCLLVALLHERRQACGLGLDRSFEALRTARCNALRNGVAGRATFVASDWGAAAAGGFDLVVSNPPYIPRGDLAGLDPEVRRHDPPLALDGGPDGLAAYRAILADAGRLLAPGGRLVVEIGHDQADAVAALAAAAGLRTLRLSRDLAGRDRALTFAAQGPGI